MYNLLEYNENYSMTSKSLWTYYRDKIDDVDDNALRGKSFKYKTKVKKKTTLALTAQLEKSGEKYQPGQSSNSLFDSNIILIFGDQLINIW